MKPSYRAEQRATREALKPRKTDLGNPGEHLTPTGKGFAFTNRKRYRQQVKDRSFTTPNYEKKHNKPGTKRKLFAGPSHPPYLSNHQRHLMRRSARG